jgi:hypothetical protein
VRVERLPMRSRLTLTAVRNPLVVTLDLLKWANVSRGAGLLRADGERPRRCRATEKRDELSPSHMAPQARGLHPTTSLNVSCVVQQNKPLDFRNGSFTTDAFSTPADQCLLLLQQRHDCSAQRSDAKGQFRTHAPQQNSTSLSITSTVRVERGQAAGRGPFLCQ